MSEGLNCFFNKDVTFWLSFTDFDTCMQLKVTRFTG